MFRYADLWHKYIATSTLHSYLRKLQISLPQSGEDYCSTITNFLEPDVAYKTRLRRISTELLPSENRFQYENSALRKIHRRKEAIKWTKKKIKRARETSKNDLAFNGFYTVKTY